MQQNISCAASIYTFKLLSWTEKSTNSISNKAFNEIKKQNNLKLIEKVDDVRPIIRSSHVLVHPLIMRECQGVFWRVCQLEDQ